MYIYRGIEVVPTGRRAEKFDRAGTKVIHTLLEIKPKKALPHEEEWVEWIATSDLYQIYDSNSNKDLNDPILLLES